MLIVANEHPQEQATFIKKTYIHLSGAVVTVILIETVLIQSRITEIFADIISHGSTVNGFFILLWPLLTLLIYFIFHKLSSLVCLINSSLSKYRKLCNDAFLVAILNAPLIGAFNKFLDPNSASTLGIFALFISIGLIVTSLTIDKKFNLWTGMLKINGFVAIGFVICFKTFGFTIGLLLAISMAIFIVTTISVNTPRIMRKYSKNNHIEATQELLQGFTQRLYLSH